MKLSKIYAKAAQICRSEWSFKPEPGTPRFGCCWAIQLAAGGADVYLDHTHPAQVFFSEHFKPAEDELRRYGGGPDAYWWGRGSDSDTHAQRVTALLLAAELAKGQGL